MTPEFKLWLEENGFDIDDLKVDKKGNILVKVEGTVTEDNSAFYQEVMVPPEFQVARNRKFISNEDIYESQEEED